MKYKTKLTRIVALVAMISVSTLNAQDTIAIGGQTWMATNLNVGTMILGENSMANNGILEKYCFDDLETNCDVYGGLYQWDEMMQYVSIEGIQGICPTGFHLPSDEEWKILEEHLGMSSVDADDVGSRGTDQGSQMAGIDSLWTDGFLDEDPSFGSSGFGALPGGDRRTVESFGNLSYSSIFWTTSEFEGGAWLRNIYYDDTEVGRYVTPEVLRYEGSKGSGFSVRCIKD